MTDNDGIAEILRYWFSRLDENGLSPPAQHQLWFQSRPETDTHMRKQFGEAVRSALAGRLDHWAREPDGLMALALLLDQFTRNIFRGTPGAFSGDARALGLAQSAVNEGIDRSMPAIHRVFLYIPYEHSEDLEVQERGILCFDRLLEDSPADVREALLGYREYAVAHRDVIAQFGRFPHRNTILGRQSTPAELLHLERHGGF
jgi:uncharacterized protein (DUF924 family)